MIDEEGYRHPLVEGMCPYCHQPVVVTEERSYKQVWTADPADRQYAKPMWRIAHEQCPLGGKVTVQ